MLRWMMWLLFKSLSCRLKLEFRPTLSSLLSVIALLPDPSLFVTFWRMMACWDVFYWNRSSNLDLYSFTEAAVILVWASTSFTSGTYDGVMVILILLVP